MSHCCTHPPPDPEQYYFEIPDLAHTRSYASQLLEQTPEDAAAKAVANLRSLGFAVLDNLIPPDRIDAVRHEVDKVTQQVKQDQRPDRDIQRPSENQPASLGDIPEQSFRSARVDRNGRNNPIGVLPQFREFLAHPVLLEVGRQMLDDHLRWCQINYRSYEGEREDGSPGGFGAIATRGKLKREWRPSLSTHPLRRTSVARSNSTLVVLDWMRLRAHTPTDTDWPHDLNAYGGANPKHNAGAIRQPFPDISMCLSCVWYLSDTGPEAGGEGSPSRLQCSTEMQNCSGWLNSLCCLVNRYLRM